MNMNIITLNNSLRNIRGFLILFITVSLLVGTSNATPLGGSAGSFMRVGFGADRLAMGDCGVALVGAGMNWYYNPAGLAYQLDRQVSIGYRNMGLDRFIMHSEFSMPIHPNAGLAIGLVRAGTENVDFRDSNGEKFDEITHSENLIHGSFSLMPHPRVGLGISVKWILNSVPDVLHDDKNLYAYGMSIDLGLRVIVLDNLQFGLQLRDLNGQYSWETSEVWGDPSAAKVDEIPTLIRIGAAYTPINPLTIVSDVVINSSEVGESSDAFDSRFGLEYRHAVLNDNLNGFAIRAGWNGNIPTFGFGLDLNLRKVQARLDYAFLLEDVAPSGSHLIGWVFEF
jgi:hypothetical protein